eukprot:14293839-Alexandrium_andersonii.AAC.1
MLSRARAAVPTQASHVRGHASRGRPGRRHECAYANSARAGALKAAPRSDAERAPGLGVSCKRSGAPWQER